MTLVETLTTAVATGRRIGRVPVLLRVVVAVATTATVLATTLPSWDAADGYLMLAVFAGIGTVLAPDSAAGLAFAGLVVMCWLIGAPGELGPAVVVTALALLVAHVAAALAAAMPLTARADLRLVGRWARPTAAIALAVLGATALTAALDAWSPAGSLLVTLAALGLVTAAAWWWSTPSDR